MREDLFGNKNEKIIKNLLGQRKPQFVTDLFFGDVKNAFFIIPQMASVVYGVKKNYSESELSVCFNLYSDIWIRKHFGLNPECTTVEYIKEVLTDKYKFIYPATICNVIDIVVDFIYRNEPAIKPKVLEQSDFVKGYVSENSVNNIGKEDIFLNDPQYGLCPEKPVFVKGFGEDKSYLQHLETVDGKPVRFHREGSMPVSGISGMVDIYTLYCEDKLYMQIFLCNYGNSTSKTAPRGLRYTPHISHSFGQTPTPGGVYSEMHYYDASGNPCDSESAVRSVGYEFDAAGKVINHVTFFKNK